MLMRLLAGDSPSYVFCTELLGYADQFRQEPCPAARTAMSEHRASDGESSWTETV